MTADAVARSLSTKLEQFLVDLPAAEASLLVDVLQAAAGDPARDATDVEGFVRDPNTFTISFGEVVILVDLGDLRPNGPDENAIRGPHGLPSR